jgi:hypothetical protein
MKLKISINECLNKNKTKSFFIKHKSCNINKFLGILGNWRILQSRHRFLFLKLSKVNYSIFGTQFNSDNKNDKEKTDVER